jgi:energy-converting hydrogenase Eha subunit B
MMTTRAIRMIGPRQFVLGLFLLSGCTSGDASAPGGSIASAGFGSFTLAPGETRTISTGAIYREFRICNDTGSGGTVEAIGSSGAAMQLAPGICALDYGDSFTLRNVSSATATGAFRSYRGKPIGKNGR